ncbi:FabG Dehydrogenases with different specificities (related to short-chain alcohol dehydrogenases) [Candidatus Nanopelagicaceae bacterium]
MTTSLHDNSGRKLALITGGSRGLGFETAKSLRSQGFDLILIAKDSERLSSARTTLLADGVANSVDAYSIDLENPSATATALEAIATTHPDINYLILAHGVMSEKMSKTLKTTDEEWRRVMAINLDSVFQIVNRLAPAIVESRNGRIVIFSACLGRMSGPGNAGGLAPYRISKAGVNALVRNLAHETGLGARGVLVDAMCPNHSRTDMGGPDAPRSAAEGAETAIWLATREFDKASEDFQMNTTGVLWEDHQIVPW